MFLLTFFNLLNLIVVFHNTILPSSGEKGLVLQPFAYPTNWWTFLEADAMRYSWLPIKILYL